MNPTKTTFKPGLFYSAEESGTYFVKINERTEKSVNVSLALKDEFLGFGTYGEAKTAKIKTENNVEFFELELPIFKFFLTFRSDSENRII